MDNKELQILVGGSQWNHKTDVVTTVFNNYLFRTSTCTSSFYERIAFYHLNIFRTQVDPCKPVEWKKQIKNSNGK